MSLEVYVCKIVVALSALFNMTSSAKLVFTVHTGVYSPNPEEHFIPPFPATLELPQL